MLKQRTICEKRGDLGWSTPLWQGDGVETTPSPAQKCLHFSQIVAPDTAQIWMENVFLGGAAVETYCKPPKRALYAKYARIS